MFHSPCHKLSHLLGPPANSSVTYFMDGPFIEVHIMYGYWGGATEGYRRLWKKIIRLHDAKSTLQASKSAIINVTTGLSLTH